MPTAVQCSIHLDMSFLQQVIKFSWIEFDDKYLNAYRTHISLYLPNTFCINAKAFAALQNDPLCLQRLTLIEKIDWPGK